jgi:hypothetical protein
MSTITQFNEKVHNEKVCIVTINNKEYDINDINRDYRCVFKCRECDTINDKIIRQTIKTGFYCTQCTKKHSLEKIGKKYWSKDKINIYFVRVVLKYNISLIKIHNNLKNHLWIIPARKWWITYHAAFMGSLSKYKILFQELLKKYEKNTKRSRNCFSNENILIEKLQNIYTNEGIEGLIPNKLDKNHVSLYSTHIYHNHDRYKEDKDNLIRIGNSFIKGCPSYWICKRLNILDEREMYLNNILTRKTDEELIDIIKTHTFNDTTQIDNKDYTTEMRVLTKRDSKKYNISFYRNLFRFPQNGYPSYDGKYILKSKAECVFYNEALSYYGIKDILYEEHIYYNKKQSIDFVIILTDGSMYGVEIWMHSQDTTSTHKSREKYIKTRNVKKKEQINLEYNFIDIEYDECYNSECLKNIFEVKMKLQKKINYNLEFILSLGDDERIKQELNEIYNMHGFISNELINSSIQHRLSRYYGGSTMENMCKIICINYDENYKKMNELKQKKHKETKDENMINKSIELCKYACDKISPNKYGTKRINQKLFLKLTNNNKCFHSKSFDGKFINLFNLCKERCPIYEDIIFAEENNIWKIETRDGKYYLYLKYLEDFINYYKLFVKKYGTHTIPFEYINDSKVALGQKQTQIRQKYKKNHIPFDYVNILNENGFIWTTRKPNL